MVQEAGFAGPVVYASFLHAELSTAPEPRLALLDGVPVGGAGFARDAQAIHVGVSVDCLTPGFAAVLRGAGLRIFVYTVNDARDIAWLESLEVDGIISDYPERVPKER
jgi:glycerophosphoryl diester phosphodiesterase